MAYTDNYKKRQGNYDDILASVDDNKPDSNPDPYAQEAMPEQFKATDKEASKSVNNPSDYDPDQIIQDIFKSSEPPKPEYNEQLQKRREKVAKLNAAGRGISVLGDILSLSTGANVQRRQPDHTTPAMLQSYQNYLEKYDDRIERHNYQKWRSELQNKNLLYRDAVRREDRNWQRGIQKESLDFRKEQAAKDEEYRNQRMQQAAEENKRKWDYNYDRLAQAQERMDWDRAKYYTSLAMKEAENKLKETKDGYQLYTSDGSNAITINDEGELQRLYTLVINDPAVQERAKNRMKLLEPTLGQPGSVNEQKVLVSELWEESPRVKEYLQNRGKLEPGQSEPAPDNPFNPRPSYQGPVRNEGYQQPAKTGEDVNTSSATTNRAENNNQIYGLIESGTPDNLNQAYIQLKTDGFNDEQIRAIFNEYAPTKPEPKRVERSEGETKPDIDLPKEAKRIESEYPKEAIELFDDWTKDRGYAVGRILAQKAGITDNQEIDRFIRDNKDRINRDIDTYNNSLKSERRARVNKALKGSDFNAADYDTGYSGSF